MRLLLDTHILIWASFDPSKLGSEAISLIADIDNEIVFSAVSIWEIAVKRQLDRPDFPFDPTQVRFECLRQDFNEIDLTSGHAIAAARLPFHHRDPFDRLLIAQAELEACTLLTRDRVIALYDSPVRLV